LINQFIYLGMIGIYLSIVYWFIYLDMVWFIIY